MQGHVPGIGVWRHRKLKPNYRGQRASFEFEPRMPGRCCKRVQTPLRWSRLGWQGRDCEGTLPIKKKNWFNHAVWRNNGVYIYLIQRTEISCDCLTFFRIHQDAVIIVIAHFTDQHALLTDGKEPAFQGGDLTNKQECVNVCFLLIHHIYIQESLLTATQAGWWTWTTHLASGRAAWMAECRTKPAMLTPKFVVPGSTTLP